MTVAELALKINASRDGTDTVTDGPLMPQEQAVERTNPGNEVGRNNMRAWVRLREGNAYTRNINFQHTLKYHLAEQFSDINKEYEEFGAQVSTTLDVAVTENDLRFNLPRIDPYNYIGDRVDQVVHHPSYTTAGDIIYGTGLVKHLATLGGLTKGMGFLLWPTMWGRRGTIAR